MKKDSSLLPKDKDQKREQLKLSKLTIKDFKVRSGVRAGHTIETAMTCD
jgi:hypothetical protein